MEWISNSFLLFSAPEAKYTHWKQTVFYIREPITIKSGEQITGEFVMKPNEKNKVGSYFFTSDDLIQEICFWFVVHF